MTGQGREIELKFHCAPEHLQAVLDAASPGEDDARQLISVYFDTPDRALERAGVSLRVRESRGKRVQTLKRGKGLVREEVERPVEALAPDATAPELQELLPDGGVRNLVPAFYVGVHRRTRRLQTDGAIVEIAVDQGEVRAVQGVSRISEIELELKEGPLAALFGLAARLMEAAPLYLSLDGKASVGQALTVGGAAGARRRSALELAPDITAAGAFQAVARDALGQIAANAALLREAASSEAIHQLRVALRRLRTAISTFSPLVKGEPAETIKDGLKWLTRACDRARDLDVYAEGVRAARRDHDAPTGLAALLVRVDQERAATTQAVREAVSSERFRRLVLDVAAWVETGAWTDDPSRASRRDAPARDFGARRLDHQLEALQRGPKDLAEASDERRHRIRIRGKKLRYAAEALGSLYDPDAVKAFLRPLKRLQDELGVLNDAAVAVPLIETLGLDAEAAFAAGERAGLHAAERERRLRSATRALKAVREGEPFWR